MGFRSILTVSAIALLTLATGAASQTLPPYDGLGSQVRKTVEVSSKVKAHVKATKAEAAQQLAKLKRNADADNPEAITDLATALAQGKGEEGVQLAAAYDLYEKAAGRGERRAEGQMCTAYLLGLNRPQDTSKGLSYCERLLAFDPTRLFSIAFERENTGQPDMNEVIKLYIKAAEAGSGDAMDAVGDIILSLPDAKPELARTWLRQAVRKGSVNGMVHLAALMESGQAGTVDKHEAYWLYSIAARKGHPAARAWLARHSEMSPLPRISMDYNKDVFITTNGLTKKFEFKNPRGPLNTEGETSLHCFINASHQLDVCVPVSEFPIGYGFADKAQTIFAGDISVSSVNSYGEETANSVITVKTTWSNR